jgi:putative inorganic carbon (hco3(-)) transporter
MDWYKKSSNKIISFLFHILFFFTPLILHPRMSEVFEFPKMLFVYVMTILITTTWIISWIKRKKITIARTPLDIPILIFLFVQILSTCFSIDPQTSLWGYYSRFHGGLASTISYILLYYALTSHILVKDQSTKVQGFINTLLLSTALISAYAVLEHFGIDKNLWVQDVQNRVFSTLGQPNWLSAYLVAILPLPIFLFIKKHKIYHLLLSLLIITAIIFTKSQSGIAATTIVLLLILARIATQNKKIPHLTALLAVSIISIYLLKPHYITKSLTSLNKINPFYSTTQEIAQKDLETRGQAGSDSMAIRRVVWQGAVDLGKKNPIIGTGPETFAYAYYWQRPAAHNLLSEWDFLYNKAHNEYLNLFATTGFLGLGSYLLLIIWTTIWWIKTAKTTPEVVPLFIGWISILITNFFGFSVVSVALLFFLFPALALPASQGKEKSKSFKIPQLLTLGLLIPTSIYLLISIVNTLKADLLYNQSRAQTKKMELLQSAVNLQPNQPLFLAQLAEEEAKTSATIFLQLESLPETAKAVQDQLEKQALDHATQAANMNQHNINLLKSKARAEIYLSNIDPKYLKQALNTLLQASLLAPTDPKLLFNIGILYQNLEKPDLATKSFKKAVELKPNYQEATHKLKP